MTIYNGVKAWAMCVHKAAEKRAASAWINDLLATEYASPNDDTRTYSKSADSALERLLWVIGDGEYSGHDWPFENLHFGFYADMWVGVSAEFDLPDGSHHAFWTEGDVFTLALAKTYERLVEVALAWDAEHAGEEEQE